jgi:CxxC motif-containing protein
MKIYPAVIVSRHPAAVEFILEVSGLPVDTPVLTGNVSREDVLGKRVYGNIPMSLASVAAEVNAVEFDGAPPRGAEYGVEEMKAAGARISRYRVELLSTCDEHVDRLDVSVRTYKNLLANGILTISDFRNMSEGEFLRHKGLGRKALSEVKQAIKKYEQA